MSNLVAVFRFSFFSSRSTNIVDTYPNWKVCWVLYFITVGGFQINSRSLKVVCFNFIAKRILTGSYLEQLRQVIVLGLVLWLFNFRAQLMRSWLFKLNGPVIAFLMFLLMFVRITCDMVKVWFVIGVGESINFYLYDENDQF